MQHFLIFRHFALSVAMGPTMAALSIFIKKTIQEVFLRLRDAP